MFNTTEQCASPRNLLTTSELREKWGAVLEGIDPVNDRQKYNAIATLMENQMLASQESGELVSDYNGKPLSEKALSRLRDNLQTLKENFKQKQEAQQLNEALPANSTGGFPQSNANVAGYLTPIMSLVRRSLPNLNAFDLCCVQPMKIPAGYIFALAAKYTAQGGTEALFDEANTAFSGKGTHSSPLDPSGAVTTGVGHTTVEGEALGDGTAFGQMSFDIYRVLVDSQTRGLAAEYTTEFAQDMKAVHGLEAETELSNILVTEINTEINRQVMRTIYSVAVDGCQTGVTTAGTFDLNADGDGRWFSEKVKGLMRKIEFEANAIAKETRRGRGNVILCDSDTASALSCEGLLNTSGGLKDNLNVDDTGSTFAGVLNGRFKLYIDPFIPAGTNVVVVGYRGANSIDGGLYYCPYVPLQFYRTVRENTGNPRIMFKTRYGLVANPFALKAGADAANRGTLTAGENIYYRIFDIANL